MFKKHVLMILYLIYIYIKVLPLVGNHGKQRGRALARCAGLERLIGSPPYAY